MHKLRHKETGDLRAEVVNVSVVSYYEQFCVSYLQLMDLEACPNCGRLIVEEMIDELSLQQSTL